MYEKLEKYLEEISHYLVIQEGKEEIISEIRSHILEKAEQEHGETSESALEKVIAAYGNPRQVAEKYIDNVQIIAPSFKKYLLRYTAIIFALHFGLTLAALLFRTSMVVFPFFYIPKMDSFQSLSYIPMILVFDIGLVGIILYFVTQSRKDIKLPWPKFKVNWEKIAARRQSKSKMIPFILMLIGYGLLIWAYLRFHTLFFMSLDFQNPESLLNPLASKWYSLALLALLGIGILAYAIKFFATSEWINLLMNILQLIIIGIVINKPIENPFVEFPYFNLQTTGNWIIAIVAVLIAIDFLKSLIVIGKSALAD
ncbi:MAG: hypothetical protein OEY18_01065 [Candidatus Aminicenantes bacterium]|nr:hypothetical protein [Candidatus Aminicenantes bacterium]MDH5383266.1 hypothetical protein [Candidatus Aminicenantes bacterium]MDH5743261.1 hypothetical protein [Candidatus Aminicenantes bacterium]